MPNWCTTEYVFTGDKDEVEYLYDWLTMAVEQDSPDSDLYVANDFGPTWLGKIVNRMESDKEAYNRFKCRGSLLWKEIVRPGRLELATETAWCAMPIMWRTLLERLELKKVNMSFYEEEPGWGIYSIYDPSGEAFPKEDMVYLDYVEGESMPEGLKDFEKLGRGLLPQSEVKAVLKKLFPDEESYPEMVRQVENKYPDAEISINDVYRIERDSEIDDRYGD